MPPHRKVPFSNKQKKEQLKAKRERKQNAERSVDNSPTRRDRKKESILEGSGANVCKLNQQPSSQSSDQINRYRLHFKADTNEDVRRGLNLSRQRLERLPEDCLELSVEDAYPSDVLLEMPKRPSWDYTTTSLQLEEIEQRYFKSYVSNVMEKIDSNREMSYFELNLETWRQIWRVLEMSDVILLISDIRYPALHFSPALYDHVVKDLKKHLILVLNKVDLAPVELVAAWKNYFETKFPLLSVVCFTSHTSNLQQSGADPGTVLHRKKRTKKSMNAIGPKQLLELCEQLTAGAVDLSSWREKIDVDSACAYVESECEIEAVDTVAAADTRPLPPQQSYSDGILTIGCCGYPNVGKSSLINGLMGKKVVSVSRTPGHTKHFQTIFLTQCVRLCDSPGLVFPSLISRPLQILSGIYPIAQLREPYSVVKYLAERLPVASLLQVRYLDPEENKQSQWSAFDICEAWAVKRGFLTAKASRPDAYRAANNILRMASEGRLCLCMRPPGYTSKHDEWRKHPDTERLSNLLGFSSPDLKQPPSDELSSSDSETDSSDSFREDDHSHQEVVDDSDDDGEGEVKLSANREKKSKKPFSTKNPFELLADDE